MILMRALACAIIAGTTLSAQRPLLGAHPLKVTALRKDLIAQLPPGRPALREDSRLFNVHKSVPLTAELVPSKRKGQFLLRGMDGARLRSVRPPRPLELALEYAGQKRIHRWSLVRDKRGILVVQSLMGVSVRLEGVDLLFLDLDHDGAFGGLWDGFIVKPRGQRGWVPDGRDVRFRAMKAPQKLADSTVWFRVDRAGFTVTVVDEQPDYSIDRHEQNLEALVVLNKWRSELGVRPLEYDYELSAACERHAIYCLNHGITHEEMETRIGYSVQGAAAGRNSVITKARTMREAIEHFLHSFYHRIDMLSPRLTRVGMAVSDGFAVMDVRTSVDKSDSEPFMWPYDGMTGVPVGWFQGEIPSPTGEEPFDERTAMRWGYPITLTLPDTEVANVSVRLLEKGVDLDPFMTTPYKPGTYAIEDNLCSILIMSRRRLRAKTRYEVVVKCSYHGRPLMRAWSFTTK